jgi:hypothetical protein
VQTGLSLPADQQGRHVGRVYAGILGPLAFVIVIARAVIKAFGTSQTLLTATICLFAFAAVGYVVGSIAQQVVEDSVREKVELELAAQESNQQSTG